MLDLLVPRKLKDECVRVKPVYLNPFALKFPVTAIVSFLHRVSGAVIFFLIPIILAGLAFAIYYPGDHIVLSVTTKILVWILLSALFYHLFAGIRHIVMDCGYLESVTAARISAYVVLIITIILSFLIGLRLCLT